MRCPEPLSAPEGPRSAAPRMLAALMWCPPSWATGSLQAPRGLPWSAVAPCPGWGEAARAGGLCGNPKGPQTNVPLVDRLDSLSGAGRWQAYPEGPVLPFLHLGPQPPGGWAAGRVRCRGVAGAGVEPDCRVGVSPALPVPCPAWTGADRACGAGPGAPSRVASHLLPLLVGEVGEPGKACGRVLPSAPGPYWGAGLGRGAWWGWVTSLLALGGWPGLHTQCDPGPWPGPCPSLCPPSSRDVAWDLLSGSAGSQAICLVALSFLVPAAGPPLWSVLPVPAGLRLRPGVSCRLSPGWSPGCHFPPLLPHMSPLPGRAMASGEGTGLLVAGTHLCRGPTRQALGEDGGRTVSSWRGQPRRRQEALVSQGREVCSVCAESWGSTGPRGEGVPWGDLYSPAGAAPLWAGVCLLLFPLHLGSF